MKTPTRIAALAAIVFAVALAAACGGSQPAPANPAASASAAQPAATATVTATDTGAKPYPKTADEADKLRASGVSWSNVEIRQYYLNVISGIRAADEEAKRNGVSAEQRARKAYQTRHDARMTCRAMMSDRHEVDDLHARDQAKYGHPDGPEFDQLVEHERGKGLTGDAAFEAIVASSQRTDGAVNEMLGVAPPPASASASASAGAPPPP